MSWCFQCGVECRPSKAVGVDEDGEPACSGHQVKGFGKKFEAAQIKTAAPSPVQIKQESTMERTCKCGCGETVPAINRFSYINGHRTRKVTPRKLKPRKVAQQIEPSNAERIDRLTDHVNREIGVAKDVPLHLRVDEGAAEQGCGTQSTERVIPLQLGESKVQKLLDLLLQ